MKSLSIPVTKQEHQSFSQAFDREETIRLLERSLESLRSGMLIDATGSTAEAVARLICRPEWLL